MGEISSARIDYAPVFTIPGNGYFFVLVFLLLVRLRKLVESTEVINASRLTALRFT